MMSAKITMGEWSFVTIAKTITQLETSSVISASLVGPKIICLIEYSGSRFFEKLGHVTVSCAICSKRRVTLITHSTSLGIVPGDRKLVVYGQVTDAPPDVSSAQARQFNSNVVIYISCTVAILVFILLILIAIKVIRRKSPNPNGYTLTSTGKFGSHNYPQTRLCIAVYLLFMYLTHIPACLSFENWYRGALPPSSLSRVFDPASKNYVFSNPLTLTFGPSALVCSLLWKIPCISPSSKLASSLRFGVLCMGREDGTIAVKTERRRRVVGRTVPHGWSKWILEYEFFNLLCFSFQFMLLVPKGWGLVHPRFEQFAPKSNARKWRVRVSRCFCFSHNIGIGYGSYSHGEETTISLHCYL